MIYHLFDTDTTAQRCLDLIARRAPAMMRMGGGPLEQECKRNTITRDERRLVVRLRKRKVSPAVIARRAGMSVMSVWKICRAAGLSRPRSKNLSAEKLARMVERRAAGWSLDRIAAEAGCSIATAERRTRGIIGRGRKILAQTA
jgi:AraC-like DNA-binding protein